MSDYLDPDNEELLQDFFMEAREQVDTLEQNILAVEDNPGDREAIDEIFRAAHTLKGGASTVQMTELAEFTHIVEDLLDDIRSDKVGVTSDVTDKLLDSLDIINDMLSARSEGNVYTQDLTEIKEALLALSEKASPEGGGAAPALSEYELLEKEAQKGDGSPAQNGAQEEEGGREGYRVVVVFDPSNPMNSVGGIQVYSKLKENVEVIKSMPSLDELYEEAFYGRVEYHVGTGKSPEELESLCSIADVTTSVEITALGGESGKDSSAVPDERSSEGPVTALPPLDEAHIAEMKEVAGDEEIKVVSVLFDEDNPMNSVGGIQVFAKLKSQGQVLDVNPPVEALYEDAFHPEVRYYMTSDQPMEALEKIAAIPDVTTSVQAKIFVEEEETSSALPLSVAPAEALPQKESPSQGLPPLDEARISEMKEAAEGQEVLVVSVLFNEENPMNSVGGIQAFAKLKNQGKILDVNPSLDDLYEDKFHPEVQYYMTSTQVAEVLEEAATIPDVTTSIQARVFLEGESSDAPAPAAQEKKEAPSTPPPAPAAQEKKEAPSTPPPAPAAQNEKEETEKKEPAKRIKESTIIKVDSERIDHMLNLVSEAVITKATFNQINATFLEIQNELATVDSTFQKRLKQLLTILPDYVEQVNRGERSLLDIRKDLSESYSDLFNNYSSFGKTFKETVDTLKMTSSTLGRNTNDLHEAVLKVRMVPIGQIFSRFPRLVRDLSKSLDKKIRLVIEGEETELDKSVIEELLDPLMHCLRNSIDHGIESPSERVAAGKPEEGQILLKASNQGNMILITIADDGKGIDLESVKKKAVERGVIRADKVLSEVEAYNLIFDPGFSTAKSVTNISGRGVGLDVVRKDIEKLNGAVSVNSSPGDGSEFQIRLPLTLAIIQGLLVKVGSETYAIPIASVIESQRIKPSEIRHLDTHEVFNLREEVVSLIRLRKLFKLHGKDDESQREYNFVVIVGSPEKKVGIIVDSLIGEGDIVIKPLNDIYTRSPSIAGATILGDGTVALIIDVTQLLDYSLEKERAARVKAVN